MPRSKAVPSLTASQLRTLGMPPWKRDPTREGQMSAEEWKARDDYNAALREAWRWCSLYITANNTLEVVNKVREGLDKQIADLKRVLEGRMHCDERNVQELQRLQEYRRLLPHRLAQAAAVMDCCAAASRHHRIMHVVVEGHGSFMISYQFGSTMVSHVIRGGTDGNPVHGTVQLTPQRASGAMFSLENGDLDGPTAAMLQAYFEATEASEAAVAEGPVFLQAGGELTGAVFSPALVNELIAHDCRLPGTCMFHGENGLAVMIAHVESDASD